MKGNGLESRVLILAMLDECDEISIRRDQEIIMHFEGLMMMHLAIRSSATQIQTQMQIQIETQIQIQIQSGQSSGTPLGPTTLHKYWSAHLPET